MRSRGLAWQDHNMAGEAGSAGHQDIRLGLVGRHPAQAGGSLATKVAEVGRRRAGCAVKCRSGDGGRANQRT